MSLFALLLFLTLLYFSYHPSLQFLFPLLCGTTICAGLWEFYYIAKEKGFQPLGSIGILFSALFIIAVYINAKNNTFNALPAAILWSFLITSFLYYFIQGSDPFVNLALTLFGFFYLTVPLSSVLYINYSLSPTLSPDGRWWVLFTLAVTKNTDVGAYISGKLLGSNKMTPYISPKKTWEGAIGGMLTGIITSLILTWAIPLPLNFPIALILGALISGLAQFGDLAESLLKRDGGVKDSNQLPGLGGMLDVLDSLIFTAPFVYLFLKFYGGF